jgi:hypothetical protein
MAVTSQCYAFPSRNTRSVRNSVGSGCLGRPMAVIRTSSEQRRALTLLASSRDGANEELLVRGHGLSRVVLSSLVRRRLAARKREAVMAGSKADEVIRFRITEAGRRAIGG